LGPTTIRFGTAASGHFTRGARIAQGISNFDGITGSVTVPEPATIYLVVGIAMTLFAKRNRLEAA
jgi:hypothetical protein